MLVQGADARPAAVARAEANSRVLTCGRVVVAPGLRAGDDASLPLRGLVASADHHPRFLEASPCRFDVLGGLMSPRG
jgi:hypothetical protein